MLLGRWTQILGVFAAKGNVKAPMLSKILLEATILAETSGLFVDFWTGDGAPWNRSMWKLFGINGNVHSSFSVTLILITELSCLCSHIQRDHLQGSPSR